MDLLPTSSAHEEFLRANIRTSATIKYILLAFRLLAAFAIVSAIFSLIDQHHEGAAKGRPIHF